MRDHGDTASPERGWLGTEDPGCVVRRGQARRNRDKRFLLQRTHARKGPAITTNLETIFGRHTWNDVRNSITRNTARRWPAMNPADVDDAVSGAIVDLVSYWVGLGSSVSDDTERNFAYAITRGTWKAKTFLGVRAEDIEATRSLEDLIAIETDNEDYIGEIATEPFGDYLNPRPPRFQSPSAEEVLIDSLSHDSIVSAINELEPGEVDSWFADFWSGDTLVDIAERRDESRFTIARRRNKGLESLANRCA